MSEHNGRQKVLVFRIGELGDTLVSLPALRAIRKNFPDAYIALLSNGDPDGHKVSPKEVLSNEGIIDEWLSYPSENADRKAAHYWRLLRMLRQEHYEILVYLAPRIRRKRDVRRDLLFFRLAGISKVIGGKGFDALPERTNGSLPGVAHEADYLLQRLSRDGLKSSNADQAGFTLRLTREEEEASQAWLDKCVETERFDFLIGFGPGSKWPSKIWPEDHFAELGTRLVQQKNIFPIVFGGPDDQELGDRLINAWGRGANAAGSLSVREAAGALKECDAYIGNDTGTMHLAAAVGTRCVAIMAAIDWPGHWNPYGAGHIVLRRTVPCEGCLLRVCAREDMRCLKEISVKAVLDACHILLESC